ncbi:MAG: hypothetical protein ACXWJ4_08890, partial [Methyloceanibacter sp.]
MSYAIPQALLSRTILRDNRLVPNVDPQMPPERLSRPAWPMFGEKESLSFSAPAGARQIAGIRG